MAGETQYKRHVGSWRPLMVSVWLNPAVPRLWCVSPLPKVGDGPEREGKADS